MSEKVLARGFTTAVRFWSPGPSDVCFGSELYDVPDAEADKALAANRAGKEIEIVQPEFTSVCPKTGRRGDPARPGPAA